MNRLTYIVLLVALSVFSCGCSIKRDIETIDKKENGMNPLLTHHLKQLNSFDEKQYVTDYFENIMDAIERKDAVRLRGMFAEDIQENNQNLDDDIKYIFEFMDGSIKKKSDMSASTTDTDSKYGRKKSVISCYFDVSTDIDDYMVFLKICNVDSEDSKNEGLRMLQIIKTADRKKYFDWGDKISCDGIFRPEMLEALSTEKGDD